jgi:hypothetical protein
VRPAPRASGHERRLRRAVSRLSGCLSALGTTQRRVLVLRAGLGPRRPLSLRAVARRLDAPVRLVRRAERSGLAALEATARSDGCEAGPAAHGAPGSPTAGSGLPSTPAEAPVGAAAGAAARPAGPRAQQKEGRVRVAEELRRGPAGVPGAATLTPPRPRSASAGAGRGAPLMLVVAFAFLAGFAAVWWVERRGDRHRAA